MSKTPSTYYLKADKEAWDIFKRVAQGFPRFSHIGATQVEIIYKVAVKSRFVAEVRKIPHQYRVFLPEKELLITIFRPDWESFNLPKKVAVMYHELMHVGFNDKTEDYYLVKHDIEDFREMIDRVGLDYGNSLEIMKDLEKQEEILKEQREAEQNVPTA